MYLHSLELDDVKCFDHLSFNFDRGESHYAGLTVIVGGNASGKSTILKAIAVVLSGPQMGAQLLGPPVGWVRRGSRRAALQADVCWDTTFDRLRESGKSPANPLRARVAISQESPDSPGALKGIQPRTPKQTRILSAERGPWNPAATGWFLGAYGPFRRLTGSSTDALRYSLGKGKVSSCVTLFREDAALSESEAWLRQAHARSLEAPPGQNAQEELVQSVSGLLNTGLLPDGMQISRTTVDQVFVRSPSSGELPMRDLSDGCRSAFALMLDLIHHMSEAYGTTGILQPDEYGMPVVDRPGIVLIDELEAHLHPAWQRTICEWLRTRFPKVQFILTTHSPLVAQAADPGGIFVLPLPGEAGKGRAPRRLSDAEETRVLMGRAEKVLLGEAFGLKRTWSERAQRLVEEWDRLTAQEQGIGLASDQAQRKQELEPKMRTLFDLG